MTEHLFHGPYRAVKRYLAALGDEMDAGPATGHVYGKSEFFREPLPTDAIAALVATLLDGRVEGHARMLDFSPWAGAYNRVPPTATAFVHRTERFLLQHDVVVLPDAPPRARAAARRWLTTSWATVHPWGTGGVYPNFPDPDLDGWAEAYYGANLDRLRQVKAHYDPDGVFRFPQAIWPQACPTLDTNLCSDTIDPRRP